MSDVKFTDIRIALRRKNRAHTLFVLSALPRASTDVPQSEPTPTPHIISRINSIL
jgi:hypothetical protein